MRSLPKQDVVVKPASIAPEHLRSTAASPLRPVGKPLDAAQLKEVGGGASIPVNKW